MKSLKRNFSGKPCCYSKSIKSAFGLSFVTDDEKFIPLGIWNWNKNKILNAQYHNWFKREVYRTNEFVYVIKGKIKCNLFTEDGTFIDSFIIKRNQGIILLFSCS